MWTDWQEIPPQLPYAPILVRLEGCEWIVSVRTMDKFFLVPGLEWKATGIYRNQQFDEVGRWS